MVKHGRAKKRRAGRIGKTKLKNKGNFRRWDPKLKIKDSTVEHLWDITKSPKQNLALMGLALDSNNNEKAANAINAIELFDVPESNLPSNREKFPLTKQEQEYILKCMKKYGTNYTKMFRNTKVNDLQYTREKLEKLGTTFLQLEEEQVLIPQEEIPTKILESMEKMSESS